MVLEKVSLSESLILPGHTLGRKTPFRSWVPFLALPLPAFLAGWLVLGAPPWEGQEGLLVFFTFLAQGLGLLAAERALRYPSREAWGVALLHLLLVTVFLAAFLALGRFYYSRAYLALATLLGVVPYLALVWANPPVRLLLLPGGRVGWLRERLRERLAPVKGVYGADGVVVDLSALGQETIPELAALVAQGLPLYDPLQVYEAYEGRVPLEHGEEVLRGFVGRGWGLYPALKRLWEVALILALSPLILPVVAGVALMVYLDLGRPVVFAQERMGLGGRSFRAYKFRTMQGAPRSGVYAGEEGDRITPLGRWLRRFRLDELPQLWNVLRGEMALIGPRPEQYILAKAYEEANPLYALRHAVRPGLTGWAQVHHGYAEGLEGAMEKLEYDLYYVKHMSFWLDVGIVVATLRTILTGFGAK